MYPTVFIVNNKERGDQLIKTWVNYYASLIDTESERDDKDIIRQVQDQESEILYHVLKSFKRTLISMFIFRMQETRPHPSHEMC
jgi:hypothetical protein